MLPEFLYAIIAICVIVITSIIGIIAAKIPAFLKSHVTDHLIVGGGIAGLYAAYDLANSGAKVILIEKSDRLGGRALQQEWHGAQIKLGAGIIRNGDSELLTLLHTLGLKTAQLDNYQIQVARRGAKWSATDRASAIVKIKAAMTRGGPLYGAAELQAGITFRKFIEESFEPEYAADIIAHFGYTDMLEADASTTIAKYPIDDIMAEGSTASYKDPPRVIASDGEYEGWTLLIETLRRKIEEYGGRIITRCGLTALEEEPYPMTLNPSSLSLPSAGWPNLIARTSSGHVIKIKLKIVIATAQDFYRQVLRAGPALQLLSAAALAIDAAVGSVPFTRAFTYYPKVEPGALAAAFKSMTIMPLEAHKNTYLNQRIVPFTDKVLMSVYADGAQADAWAEIYKKSSKAEIMARVDQGCLSALELAQGPPARHKILGSDELNYKFKSTDIIWHYWPIGIHYWRPAAQNNTKSSLPPSVFRRNYGRIGICGEVVAPGQGWVNGAIESVNLMLNEWK
jgi:NAD(P)-binding Rossmann-like domain